MRKDTGRAGQSPIFSDCDATTLVYPDLAVGDTVVLAYRITTFASSCYSDDAWSGGAATDCLQTVGLGE